jgi:hypothetical protein
MYQSSQPSSPLSLEYYILSIVFISLDADEYLPKIKIFKISMVFTGRQHQLRQQPPPPLAERRTAALM